MYPYTFHGQYWPLDIVLIRAPKGAADKWLSPRYVIGQNYQTTTVSNKDKGWNQYNNAWEGNHHAHWYPPGIWKGEVGENVTKFTLFA